MGKYLVVLLTSTKDAFVFQAEGLVYFLADLMTPLLLMIAWQAIFRNRLQVGHYFLHELLIYYLFVFIFRTLLSVYPQEIARYIRTGELNFFLVKPVSLVLYQLAGEIAWKIIRLLFLSVSVLVLIKLFLPISAFPLLHVNSLGFYMAIIFAFLLNFYLKVAIELLAFWLTEIDGVRISFYVLEAFFAGALLPLDLMPKLIQDVAIYLPFRYFFYVPTQIILGKLSENEMLLGLSVASVWLLGAILISKVIFKTGLKSYSAVSG